LKLTDQQRQQVDRSGGTNLMAALELAENGWHVFPLRPGTKIPLISKQQGGRGCLDGTTNPDQIIEWWTQVPNAGIGANLGDDRVAFDIDIQNGGRHLDSFPTTRTHVSGRGNGNKHLIYRFEPGSQVSQLKPKTAALGRGMDIKIGRGGYIVMPPTRHESTGQPYTISRVNNAVEHTLTDLELAAIVAESNVSPTRPSTTLAPTGDKSSLSSLLSDPPAEGGRNDWLTKIAGHYARKHRDNFDLYHSACLVANDMLSDPLAADEVAKTTQSVWDMEQRNHPERNATLETGYLVADGPSLMCQTIVRQGDQQIPALGHFADFNIEAIGIAIDTMDRRTYWVRVITPSKTYETTLPGEIFGDDRAIRKWLASRGLTVDPPINSIPRTAIGVRLMRYLNSMNPPKVNLTDQLGWYDQLQAFVTHDGLITSKGHTAKEQAGVVANPNLVERDVAPYNYGFQHSLEKAQNVLAEVLTYQEETVASVFGAWWAACLLKPQIQTRTSLFPFFGVEAVSESGKTNGFFHLMVQLNGNHRGEIAPTKPVLRDYASANRSGIVWADDLDTLEPYGEILRAATSNGVWSKMDVDRNAVKNVQIVAPILLTGETLGMGTQKALIDRSVILNVPSPKGRKSTRGDWAQWEDVLDLIAQYPKENGGLTTLSGWYVQQALAYTGEIMEALKQAKTKAQGRQGDKFAVLRAGAHLLELLVGQEKAGEGQHSRTVEAWIERQTLEGWLERDNTLTTQLIPWAIRTFGYPTHPQTTENGRFAGIDTPAFTKNETDQTELWVSIPLLAQAWARDRNHRVDQRTESETALKQQADALKTLGGKTWHVANSDHKGWYRQIPQEYIQPILNRALGTDVRPSKVEVSTLALPEQPRNDGPGNP
jgi:hypothetical protein